MSDEDRDIDIESDVSMEKVIAGPDLVKSLCLQSSSLTFFQLTLVLAMCTCCHVHK